MNCASWISNHRLAYIIPNEEGVRREWGGGLKGVRGGQKRVIFSLLERDRER
jgi:hypothetical protein